MIRFARTVAFYAVLFTAASVYSVERRGADLAYPAIESYLSGIHLQAGDMRILSDSEVASLVELSAAQGINVFELIDCSVRYAKTLGTRIQINGNSLRAAEKGFSLGDERVLSILPVEKLVRLECGAVVLPGQKEVDIYLDSKYESYIEIGKALYETRFGFENLSPNLFDGCYGVQVNRFLFTSPLVKLELYAPAKGAIYVKGVPKPKRWNLQIIREKN